MENASKALLMAAGVLMGLLIISLAVYLYTNLGLTANETLQKISESETRQFNNQFTVYENKNDITIYDVVSVANIATDNNKYYDFAKKILTSSEPTDYYVAVILEGNQIEYGTEKKALEIQNEYNGLVEGQISGINSTNPELPTYTCQTFISLKTQRVYKVVFTKKT